MRKLTLAVALVLVAPGCGADGPVLVSAGGAGGAAAARSAAAQDPPVPPGSPPTIHLRGGGRKLSLRPFSFCWREGAAARCGDGPAPRAASDIGSPAQVEMAFAATGWQFTATFERSGTTCGRARSTQMTPTGPGAFLLEPMGPAGDYTVSLFGRGQDAAGTGGDALATFRWHTPRDGPTNPAAARASVLSGQPPEVGSVGISLMVEHLRTTPASARASVVVTSSNGASLPIGLEPDPQPCARPGSLSFTAAEALGHEAARLGPAPFRYEISLTIDGVTYRGQAQWPDDMVIDSEPSTRLRFDPPLPSL